MKRESLIYLNTVTDQLGRELYLTKGRDIKRIDTIFVDMEIRLTVGKKLYDPRFYQRMLEIASLFEDMALEQGFNRIVTHFQDTPNRFPVTMVYYVPGAQFKLNLPRD